MDPEVAVGVLLGGPPDPLVWLGPTGWPVEFLAPLMTWFVDVELSDILLILPSRSGVLTVPAGSEVFPPLEWVELLALWVEPESEELLMTLSLSSRLGRQSCNDAVSMTLLSPSTTKMTCNWYLQTDQYEISRTSRYIQNSKLTSCNCQQPHTPSTPAETSTYLPAA